MRDWRLRGPGTELGRKQSEQREGKPPLPEENHKTCMAQPQPTEPMLAKRRPQLQKRVPGVHRCGTG